MHFDEDILYIFSLYFNDSKGSRTENDSVLKVTSASGFIQPNFGKNCTRPVKQIHF